MDITEVLLLIKNLSPAERKSFRRWAEQKSEKTNYEKLYDELRKLADTWNPEEQPVPPTDEDKLSRWLTSEKIRSPLKVLKHNMLDAILGSLRQLYEDKTMRDKADMAVRDARILERRGLLRLAADKLKEALDIANQYAYHALAAEIVIALIRLELQFDLKTYAQSLQERFRQLEELTHLFQEDAAQYVEFHRLFLAFRLDGGTRMPAPQTSGFLAEIYRLQALSLQSALRGEKVLTLEYSKAMIALWEKHPHQKTERPGLYIRHVSNHLNFCITAHSVEFHEQYINELQDIRDNTGLSFDDEAELTQALLLTKQQLLLNTNQLEAARDLHAPIDKMLKAYGEKINKSREITLRFNIMITYFGLSEFEEALKQCAILKQLRHKQLQRRDLQLLGNVFRFILYYEKGQQDELKQIVKVLGRQIHPESSELDFERQVQVFLVTLAEVELDIMPVLEGQRKRRAAFAAFQQQLKTHSAAKALRIGLEEIDMWISSRQTKESFRELLGRRYRKPVKKPT